MFDESYASMMQTKCFRPLLPAFSLPVFIRGRWQVYSVDGRMFLTESCNPTVWEISATQKDFTEFLIKQIDKLEMDRRTYLRSIAQDIDF